MSNTLHIRPWTTDDIPFAKRMTDIEEWGNTTEDFERLFRIQPDGCFIGLQNDKPVGMITAIIYGDYGFLGTMIVPAEYRGEGLGEKLMRYAIDYLTARGVKTIELDGVMEALPLYRRLGFCDKHQSLRLFRPAGKLVSASRPAREGVVFRQVTKDEIEALLTLDKKLTSLNRAKSIEVVCAEFPELVFGAFDAFHGLTGYLTLRPLGADRFCIGPLIASDNALSIDLLNAVLKQYCENELRIGVLATARFVEHWLLRQGFERHPPCMRMYLGEPLQYETHMAAILSPEKG